jgi:hypothetical protein
VGKSEAPVEDGVLNRKVGAYLRVYMADLSRTQKPCDAELCGILY